MSTIPAAVLSRRAKITAEHGGYPTEQPPEQPSDAPAASDAPADTPVDGVTGFDESLFAVAADPGQNVPTAAPAPVAEPGAQSPADEGTWQQRYRSLQGMFNQQADKLRLLQTKIEALTNAPPAPAAAPASAPTQQTTLTVTVPDVPALTPEQTTTYGAAMPVIRRVAADLVGDVVRPIIERLTLLERGVATATETTTSVQSAVVGLADRSFQSTLRIQIPDLDTLSRTQAFASYLDNVIPYSGGQSVRDRLKTAYDARDAETIVRIVSEFRGKEPTAGRPTVTPSHFQQPGGQGGQPPSAPEPQAKPMLAWSKRVEASEKFRKGQISSEQLKRITVLYEQAAAEGRIDMNA